MRVAHLAGTAEPRCPQRLNPNAIPIQHRRQARQDALSEEIRLGNWQEHWAWVLESRPAPPARGLAALAAVGAWL